MCALEELAKRTCSKSRYISCTSFDGAHNGLTYVIDLLILHEPVNAQENETWITLSTFWLTKMQTPTCHRTINGGNVPLPRCPQFFGAKVDTYLPCLAKFGKSWRLTIKCNFKMKKRYQLLSWLPEICHIIYILTPIASKNGHEHFADVSIVTYDDLNAVELDDLRCRYLVYLVA